MMRMANQMERTQAKCAKNVFCTEQPMWLLCDLQDNAKCTQSSKNKVKIKNV